MRYADRQERVLQRMAEQGVDALLVTNLTNVRYTCGYVGSNGSVLLSAKGRTLFTDFRYLQNARASRRVVWRSSKRGGTCSTRSPRHWTVLEPGAWDLSPTI